MSGLSESESDKSKFIRVLFINFWLAEGFASSCSVVRSIMTDSRSVDPGSNPGTSTNRYKIVSKCCEFSVCTDEMTKPACYSYLVQEWSCAKLADGC